MGSHYQDIFWNEEAAPTIPKLRASFISCIRLGIASFSFVAPDFRRSYARFSIPFAAILLDRHLSSNDPMVSSVIKSEARAAIIAARSFRNPSRSFKLSNFKRTLAHALKLVVFLGCPLFYWMRSIVSTHLFPINPYQENVMLGKSIARTFECRL